MTIQKGRFTTKADAPFVIFLIGMRFNRWWKLHRWLPVVMAMPAMLKELQRDRSLGFLHAETWFGRTTIMVQYWSSFEALEAYAKSSDHTHLPAWASFRKRIGDGADVGIWHETYRVEPGQYETVYGNMPVFGLAKAMRCEPIGAGTSAARARLDRA